MTKLALGGTGCDSNEDGGTGLIVLAVAVTVAVDEDDGDGTVGTVGTSGGAIPLATRRACIASICSDIRSICNLDAEEKPE